MDKKEGALTQKKNIKLPNTNQLDTVSPATRLLEKRRLMYEKQEEYEQKKKEFKQYIKSINMFQKRGLLQRVRKGYQGKGLGDLIRND